MDGGIPMDDWTTVGYLVSAVLFILGLKRLSRPRTAVRGNQLGAAGMLVAVVVTLADNAIIGFGWIVGGLVLGTAVGALLAVRGPDAPAMPELVALFNGFGGGASVLVASASYVEAADLATDSTRLSAAAAAGFGDRRGHLHGQPHRLRQAPRGAGMVGLCWGAVREHGRRRGRRNLRDP